MRDVSKSSSVSWMLSDYPEPCSLFISTGERAFQMKSFQELFSLCIECFYGSSVEWKSFCVRIVKAKKEATAPCMTMWVDPHTFAVCALKISITLKIIILIAQLFPALFLLQFATHRATAAIAALWHRRATLVYIIMNSHSVLTTFITVHFKKIHFRDAFSLSLKNRS